MFDVAFSEFFVVALVALIVIGPERLPKVARVLGNFVRKMRSYVASVKVEVEREMQLEDLKKIQQEIYSNHASSEFLENSMIPQSEDASKNTQLDKTKRTLRKTSLN